MASDYRAKENLLREKLTQARLKEYEIQKKLMEAEREFEEEREEWRDLKQQLLSHSSSVRYNKNREEMVGHFIKSAAFFITCSIYFIMSCTLHFASRNKSVT